MYKTGLFQTLTNYLTPEWLSAREGLTKKRRWTEFSVKRK